MKSATSAQRPYQEVGAMIRDLIIKTPYNPGERLPPEREIAEMLDVTRTVVREALIMLEIKGLVEVRRGAGIYVLDNSGSQNTDSPDANVCNDAGPFELLQARQLLESNIAEFAALQATREDIVKMRQALQLEERELASSAPGSSESGDMQFHLAIAEATHNSMLVELFRQSWQWRENNPMWIQLHSHLDDSLYPFISTVYDARTGKNDTYENRKIRCYEAELIDMDIEKNNTPASTITLSDGTELRVYPDSDHTLYTLANGTDLLLENHLQTPENTMAVGKKNIDHLEENAKASVLAYYEERGRLYDIMEELEKASAIYQQSQNKENFSMMRIEQNVYPTAANDRLIFFQTSLHLPLAEKTFTERNLCEVFDRKTGAYIPIEDLFICPLEELGSQLLALAHLSDADRADMETAFRREYIFFTEDSLCIDFPAGSLTNYKEQYIVPLKYTSDLRGLMHDWAIPKEG